MGFADVVTTTLFLNRRRSDVELTIQSILQRKLGIMDECNKISEILAEAIFQGDNYSAISPGGLLPGMTPSNPLVELGPEDPIPTGYYEAKLAELQGLEKELDTRQKKLEIELEAVKAEQESMQKIADDRAKKDFKVGG